MAAPVAPDGAEITTIHWLVGMVAGIVSATLTALAFIWHAATRAAEMKKDIAQNILDIAALRRAHAEHADELAEVDAKGNQRHEENLRAIGHISVTVAALPDKHDFQRLEDRLIGEIKQAVAQAR